MNKSEIACGDIVTENAYSQKRKVIVIAHGVNGLQPLVVEIVALVHGRYSPYWTTYESITEKHGHINLNEAILKQIPQKPLVDEEQDIQFATTYICPSCGGKFTGRISQYCYHCGQKLDWED